MEFAGLDEGREAPRRGRQADRTPPRASSLAGGRFRLATEATACAIA
jgi:hypothetical protein